MCGITGYFHRGAASADATVVNRMTAALQHRGPDAEGYWSRDRIALGHRRLAIIDLSDRSNQPFLDSTHQHAIIFNGEIYNFQELRSQLREYAFQTQSDTEVVLAAFLQWGWKCLDYLKGMFAFAVWDERKQSLFLARDRMGVKPLYYFQDGDHFLFASEIRALLASGKVPRKIDQSSLPEYFQFQSFQYPHTLVDSVRELGAGCFMEVNPQQQRTQSYWQLPTTSSIAPGVPDQVIQKKVKELFFAAVQRRMVADVPVAAFLSGGIDSAALVAAMAELGHQPETFTVSFEEKEYDESAHAALVAKKYQTRHHTLLIRSSDLWEQLPEALHAMDTPSGDGLNTYIISRAVSRQGIKVALSGVGGDELFAGYPIFRYWRRMYQLAPVWGYTGWLREKLASWLPHDSMQQQRRAALLRLPELTISSVYPLLRQVNTPEFIESILAFVGKPNNSRVLSDLAHQDISGLPLLSQLSYAEYQGYTRQTLLKDMDQMSMACSLELREPYFDHELIEWVVQIPDSYKSGRTPKSLFVQVLGDMLPAQLYTLPKRGFVLPAEKWFRQELRSFCTEKINQLAHRELFHTEGVLTLWNHFLSGQRGIRWSTIFQLIALENYLERHQLT